MVAAVISGAASTEPRRIPKTTSHENPSRPPLQRDNNGVVGPKRFKSRQVSSRYMSPSSSTSTSTSSSASSSSSSTPKRCPSPLVSRNATSVSSTPVQVPNRSVSVDRRRPLPSRPFSRDPGSASESTKPLFTSTRSLSVSFQVEAFSLPVSKTKAAPQSPSLRKGTPERRRSSTPQRGKAEGGGGEGSGDQVENSRPTDQLPWPARTRQPNPNPNPMSRSLDYSVDEKNLVRSGVVFRALQESGIDESKSVSFDDRLGIDLSNSERNKGSNETCVTSEHTASDTDSVSSGSTSSGVQECGVNVGARTEFARGIAGSARFWQETNTRLRRLQDNSGSILSTSPAKMMVLPKFSQTKRVSSDSPSNSPRRISSPLRGGMRPASPCKLMTPVGSSPSRGIVSPSRFRSSVAGTISTSYPETPSVLSFAVDVRRGKVGENRIVDAHVLRLLYNRHLQWRFVNARSEAAFMVQIHSAENYLGNAWIKISELRDEVMKRRYRLQLLRQKLKLASILKGQMTCLEDCASLEKDHEFSVLAAIEALKASTLRLPVVGGAIADVQSIKDAIGSAVDVMQAMASSMSSLLSKVKEVNSLMSELAKVIAKEQALLGQCKNFFSLLVALQVKHSSLRTHLLQLNRGPTA